MEPKLLECKCAQLPGHQGSDEWIGLFEIPGDDGPWTVKGSQDEIKEGIQAFAKIRSPGASLTVVLHEVPFENHFTTIRKCQPE